MVTPITGVRSVDLNLDWEAGVLTASSLVFPLTLRVDHVVGCCVPEESTVHAYTLHGPNKSVVALKLMPCAMRHYLEVTWLSHLERSSTHLLAVGLDSSARLLPAGVVVDKYDLDVKLTDWQTTPRFSRSGRFLALVSTESIHVCDVVSHVHRYFGDWKLTGFDRQLVLDGVKWSADDGWLVRRAGMWRARPRGPGRRLLSFMSTNTWSSWHTVLPPGSTAAEWDDDAPILRVCFPFPVSRSRTAIIDPRAEKITWEY